MISRQWSTFQQLNCEELYEILRIRQEIFTVEQHCAYQDADGLDCCALHLQAWDPDSSQRRIVGYLRVLPPGSRFAEPSIGRLLVIPALRRCGLGRDLMKEALERIAVLHPGIPVRISAQWYLQNFYVSLGFTAASVVYDEDGIPHLDMLRLPEEQPPT
jgi:ElaA protein